MINYLYEVKGFFDDHETAIATDDFNWAVSRFFKFLMVSKVHCHLMDNTTGEILAIGNNGTEGINYATNVMITPLLNEILKFTETGKGN